MSMTPSQYIQRAIEASLWDYEPDFNPPGLVVVDRPDRLLWRSPSDSIYANKVVRASFSETNADAGVAEIMALFEEAGKPFSWWVGPSSGPASLEQRLQPRGLVQVDTYEGVALVLDGVPPIPSNPNVTVTVVEMEAEVRELVRVNAEVWGYAPEDQRRMVQERLAYLALPGRRGGYLLAHIGGQAAGTASFRYSSSGEALYLTGAATLPEFRNRGVFTELVRWRLGDALTRGCRLATCLARLGTSASILMKLGFEQYLTMPVYAWGSESASP